MAGVDPEKVGFVIIACRPFEHSLKAEVFIESLVKHGKWNRKIFLTTELPKCFNVDWIRQVAASSHIFIVPIPTFSHRLDFPFAFRTRRWAGTKWPLPGFVHSLHGGAHCR